MQRTCVDRLCAIRGLGPWTAQYIAMRALSDPDAFPAGDLVLLRAAGMKTTAEMERHAERWRPWRAYAAMHLWQGVKDGTIGQSSTHGWKAPSEGCCWRRMKPGCATLFSRMAASRRRLVHTGAKMRRRCAKRFANCGPGSPANCAISICLWRPKARPSISASGASCAIFLMARRSLMANWRDASDRPTLRAQWDGPMAPIPSRS